MRLANLTDPQRDVLAYLASCDRATLSAVARMRAGRRSQGVSDPAKALRMGALKTLLALGRRALVTVDEHHGVERWTVTEKGHRLLATATATKED